MFFVFLVAECNVDLKHFVCVGFFEDREGEEEREVLSFEEVCNQGIDSETLFFFSFEFGFVYVFCLIIIRVLILFEGC